MGGLSWYAMGGWVLGGIGVFLVLMGVFAGRIVTRRSAHCAKCGYSLADIPAADGAVRCPECGRVPTSPAEMYTMRRRRWPVVVGAVLFVGALVLPMVPTMRVGGWRAALPMSVQIRMWSSGDMRLHVRIENAYNADRLNHSQKDLLRTMLREALADQQLPDGAIAAAVSYLREVTTKKVSLLSEEDMEEVLRNGGLKQRSLALQFASWGDAPKTQGLQEARRDAVFAERENPEDRSQGIAIDWLIPEDRSQGIAIDWLIKAPADTEEDREAVRVLIAESEDRVFWRVFGEFDDAAPLGVEVAVSLLDDPRGLVRRRALRCIEARLGRAMDYELSEQAVVRILEMSEDPDARVRFQAVSMVERLPISGEPMIDQLLRTERDPEALDQLIYGVRRRSPDAVGLLPAMAAVTRDEGHPLRLRLKAADACFRLEYRMEGDDERREGMWAVYDALIRRLEAGDMQTGLVYGKEIGLTTNAWAVGVIARRMLEDEIDGDEVEGWLGERPGVDALFRVWEPGVEGVVDRYQRVLSGMAMNTKRTPRAVRETIVRVFAVQFPNERLIVEDSPEPISP